MKKLIVAFILGGLLSTGLFALYFQKREEPAPADAFEEADWFALQTSPSEATRPASPVSIAQVLGAHNVPQAPDALSAFSAEALRLVSRPPKIDHEMASFFERLVRVDVAGNTYKRYTADRMRLREQFDLFDGTLPYHAVVEKGRLAQAANQMTESQARDVEFGVKTFGLAPVLKQLLDPATEVAYLGRTRFGQDKFYVKTATDGWKLYTDAEHFICRVEAGGNTIEYADYRSVDGIRLPFIQRFSIGGKLRQELIFSRIDLNPALAADHFSRDAITKETTH